MNALHTLIIGGTRGIGRELADLLVREGHTVSVLARTLPTEAARPVNGMRYWRGDVQDVKRLGATLRRLVQKDGKINHLIFFQRYRGDGDSWKGELETSIEGTKTVVELMQDQFAGGDKSIVIVSSINATLISPHLSLGYHVAKAALCQMVRYWAVTLGWRGIRVNSVSPGTVLKKESKEFVLRDKRVCKLYRRIVPLGRIGTAAEVAQVIAFLCSEKASFVTGQDLVVDGGVSVQFQEALAQDLQSTVKGKAK